METLQRIIAAEKEASRILEEAEAKRASQEERIRAGRDALLLQSRDEADAAVAKAEAEARERADAALASMEAETRARLAALRADFEGERERYADRLFRLSVGEDDES